MKILVTGATGFTGKRVLPLLMKRGEVFIFARKTSDLRQIQELNLPVRYGDLSDFSSLEKALDGMDGILNLSSLVLGGIEEMVKILERNTVKRALFVSTTAIFTNLPAQSKKIRLHAENAVQNSNLDWTIIRPTMIYGAPDDRNMIRLLKFLKISPLVIVPGDGRGLQRPIFVEDLARAIVDAYFNPNTYKKSYNVSGKEALTFDEVIDTAARAMGKNPLKIHIPVKFIIPPIRVFEKIFNFLNKKPIIKEEQILRLLEDKSFEFSAATRDFNFGPCDFACGISKEVTLTWPKKDYL